MAIFENDDIETMLEDWGNLLTAGNVTAPCCLDDKDQEVLDEQGGGGQIVRRITATIRSSDFPNLAANDPIEIDGIPYTVWRRLQLGDGGIAELWLRLDEGS